MRFWETHLTMPLTRISKKNKTQFVFNLASQEYFKAAKASKIEGKIISPSFLDEKNGKYKIISFYAKKARGYMANYLVTNKVTDPKALSTISQRIRLPILKIRFILEKPVFLHALKKQELLPS